MVVKIKTFCLTFDIEEFDIARGISEDEMNSVSAEGTKRILRLLKEENVKATFFITSRFAQKNPKLVVEIGKEHEIGSHGEAHSYDYSKLNEQKAFELIKKSKDTLEGITKKQVFGFRAPRMRTVNPLILKKAGFRYSASSHPAFIPGRYKDFLKPRNITAEDGMIIVPTSVTPVLRIPLMWYGLRNYGMAYAKTITKLSSISTNYASIYLHSWEFSDIRKYNVSEGIKKNTGQRMEEITRQYIRWCKRKYNFKTISDMLTQEVPL